MKLTRKQRKLVIQKRINYWNNFCKTHARRVNRRPPTIDPWAKTIQNLQQITSVISKSFQIIKDEDEEEKEYGERIEIDTKHQVCRWKIGNQWIARSINSEHKHLSSQEINMIFLSHSFKDEEEIPMEYPPRYWRGVRDGLIDTNGKSMTTDEINRMIKLQVFW